MHTSLPVRALTVLFVICRPPPLFAAGLDFHPVRPTPCEYEQNQGKIPAALRRRGYFWRPPPQAGLFLVENIKKTDAQQRTIKYGDQSTQRGYDPGLGLTGAE